MKLAKLPQALKDAAQVAEDACAVALKFQSLPQALVSAGKDAVAAVTHWSAESVRQIHDDVTRVRDEFAADAAGAGPEFDRLEADLQLLVADLS